VWTHVQKLHQKLREHLLCACEHLFSTLCQLCSDVAMSTLLMFTQHNIRMHELGVFPH
jgi:hypothetical protein